MNPGQFYRKIKNYINNGLKSNGKNNYGKNMDIFLRNEQDFLKHHFKNLRDDSFAEILIKNPGIIIDQRLNKKRKDNYSALVLALINIMKNFEFEDKAKRPGLKEYMGIISFVSEKNPQALRDVCDFYSKEVFRYHQVRKNGKWNDETQVGRVAFSVLKNNFYNFYSVMLSLYQKDPENHSKLLQIIVPHVISIPVMILREYSCNEIIDHLCRVKEQGKDNSLGFSLAATEYFTHEFPSSEYWNNECREGAKYFNENVKKSISDKIIDIHKIPSQMEL